MFRHSLLKTTVQANWLEAIEPFAEAEALLPWEEREVRPAIRAPANYPPRLPTLELYSISRWACGLWLVACGVWLKCGLSTLTHLYCALSLYSTATHLSTLLLLT